MLHGCHGLLTARMLGWASWLALRRCAHTRDCQAALLAAGPRAAARR